MCSVNARDHFNCSPLLFSWPAPQNRCGQMERGGGKKNKNSWINRHVTNLHTVQWVVVVHCPESPYWCWQPQYQVQSGYAQWQWCYLHCCGQRPDSRTRLREHSRKTGQSYIYTHITKYTRNTKENWNLKTWTGLNILHGWA